MAERHRLLDLDEIGSVSIKLGGKEFKIGQQRQAILERVLRFAHTDPKVEEGEDRSFADLLFANWDDALPYFALILGFEKEDEQADCVLHLKEYLTIPAALTIYETWWEVNRIEDFFNRGSRPMLPPYILKMLAEEGLPAPTQAPVVTN